VAYSKDKFPTKSDYIVALIKGEEAYSDGVEGSGISVETKLALSELMQSQDKLGAEVRAVAGDDYDALMKRFVENIVPVELSWLQKENVWSDAISDATFIFDLCRIAGLSLADFDRSALILCDRIKTQQAETCTNPWMRALVLAEGRALQISPERAEKYVEAICEHFRYADYAEGKS
jgi:hypothetical protein